MELPSRQVRTSLFQDHLPLLPLQQLLQRLSLHQLPSLLQTQQAKQMVEKNRLLWYIVIASVQLTLEGALKFVSQTRTHSTKDVDSRPVLPRTLVFMFSADKA